MNLIFRTVFHLLRSRRKSPLGIMDVGVDRYRVLPTDLDVLGHMNNGVYFSIMDLARMDLMIRSGAWTKFRQKGFYPVMASETMTFRKSLQPWQLFDVESRIVGFDAKAIFMEQRFVVDGEIYAKAMTKARFLQKSGTVSLAELADLVGLTVDALPAPPEWVTRWSEDVLLPTTRQAAPNLWS